MEKRLILAISLSLLFLLTWSSFISKTQHIADKEVINKTNEPFSPAPLPRLDNAITRDVPQAALISFPRGKEVIRFNESRAAIKEILFRGYGDHVFLLTQGLATGTDAGNFKKEAMTEKDITFIMADQNKKITKKFDFSKSIYTIGLDLTVENLSGSALDIQIPLAAGILDLNYVTAQSRFQDAVFVKNDKITHYNGSKNVTLEGISFLGLRDKYFCVIVEPPANNFTAYVKKLGAKDSEIGLFSPLLRVAPYDKVRLTYSIYLGPQDLHIINKIKPGWGAIIHYGAFDFIAQLLLQALEFFNRIIHNWGLAIILLTASIFLLLFPLTVIQTRVMIRNMKQMEEIKPHLEALKAKFKDNPAKLNEKTMELYRQYKINPFGGCLPILLQMPIFFALYQALIRFIYLKGEKFLWISDLSEPDNLIRLPVILRIPLLGTEVRSINILPIVIAVIIFMQQKISMLSSGSDAGNQKFMMVLSPVLFALIFYNMPSAFNLYFFTNTVLMFLYQSKIYRASKLAQSNQQ